MIEAHDLRRRFNETEAVAGISFSVKRGEIFGLLGPNGAGKTTTIRVLTGQIDPSEGSAVAAGCDVVRDHAQLKARIGVVFEEQNPAHVDGHACLFRGHAFWQTSGGAGLPVSAHGSRSGNPGSFHRASGIGSAPCLAGWFVRRGLGVTLRLTL